MGKMEEGNPQDRHHEDDLTTTGSPVSRSEAYEKLLEENKALKASLEDLGQSLRKKKKAMKKQKRSLTKMEEMIARVDWVEAIKEYKSREAVMAELLAEEKTYNVKTWNKIMLRVSRKVREKEEEARKLSKWVARLRAKGNQVGEISLERDKVMQVGGRTALTILPEEIWKLILDNAANPEDLWNCCNTCPLFEEILRPWKTGWMLEQALPLLQRHLSGTTLLKCRQVSRGWCAGVTRFLENHPSIQPHRPGCNPRIIDFVYPVKDMGIGDKNCFTFAPDEDLTLTKLGEMFPKELDRNPFVGRYVNLYLRNPVILEEDEGPVEEDRWRKLYSFLESYGKHILDLAIHFPSYPRPETLENVQGLLISKLFQLVPNLRKLCITNPGFLGVDEINPELLAPAPNLIMLHADQIKDDELVYALLERYHDQLCGIQVTEDTWRLLSNLEWPSLTDMVLYMGDDAGEDVNFESLQGVGLRMPQLSRLSLSLEDIGELDFHKLIPVINELTSTTRLNTLQLAGPLEGIRFAQLDTNLYASQKLKTLELSDPWYEGSRSLPSHNFLRCYPLLENLVMYVRKIPKPSSIEKYHTERDMMPDEELRKRAARLQNEPEFIEVNKYAYKAQMYKSNIWVLLPRLKVLTFQWDIYTREEYEATR